MLDEISNPGSYEQHLLPVNLVENIGFPDPPPNLNRYLVRAIDIDVVTDEQETIVFTKMCKIIVAGFIDRKGARRWHNTKVRAKRGTFQVGNQQYKLPGSFGNYLMDRARKTSELSSEMSEKQRKKINEAYRQNPDRTVESESFKAMEQDVKLFGKKAFKGKK